MPGSEIASAINKFNIAGPNYCITSYLLTFFKCSLHADLGRDHLGKYYCALKPALSERYYSCHFISVDLIKKSLQKHPFNLKRSITRSYFDLPITFNQISYACSKSKCHRK